MSLVSSISALATRVSAEFKLFRQRRDAYVYQMLDSELAWYAPGANDATRLAAIAKNSAAIKAVVYAYPGARIRLPKGRAYPVQLDFNGFTDSAFLPAVPIDLEGAVQQPCGSWTQADADAFKASGTIPANKVRALPAVQVTRPFGAPVDILSTFTLKLGFDGANIPVNTFAQKSTAVRVSSFAGYQAGDTYHLVSNDGYAWSAAAGYENPAAAVWKGQFVVLAGQGITVANYSRTAVSAAAGYTLGTLETRTIKGASSQVQGVVQGDDLYANHLVFSSLTGGTGNFQANENLIDVETNAVVGTVTDQYLITTSMLDTSYTTTPMWRKVFRNAREVNLKLRVEADGNPDDFVMGFNREVAVGLTGVTDFKADVDIRTGYQRGITLTSCYRGEVKAWVQGLPNHALEVAIRYQNAYGYGIGFFGSTEGVQAYVNGEHLRHGISTNGVGGSWNLDDRTGRKDSAVNCTNYHKYGTVRGNRFSADTRFTFAAGIDTHEGCQRNIIENFHIRDPFFAARAVSNGAGVSNRGFDTLIRNGRITNCYYGIIDTGVTIDSGGLVYTNRVQNVVVENFYAAGYFQGNHAFSKAQSTIVIENCTFRGDPNVGTADIGLQAGIYLQDSISETRGNKFESISAAHIIHTGGGKHTHIDPIFDFSTDQGTTGIRVQATIQLTLVNPHYKLGATLRPQSFLRSTAGATKFRVHGLTWEFTGTNTTMPVDLVNDSGSTATIEIIAWDREKAAYATASLPTGGSAGQVLRKSSATDGDAAWSWPAQPGTRITIDGGSVLTDMDISSAQLQYTATLAADWSTTASTPNGTTTELGSLQVALPVGTYQIDACLSYSAPATGGPAFRVGIGGAGAAGASAVYTVENNNNPSAAGLRSALTTIGAAGSSATSNGTNVFGNSAGTANVNLPVTISGRLIVTAAGTFGVMLGLNGGTTTVLYTVKAGSSITFTKVA